MRPTERTRERTPAPAAPRPAERLFTTRELLLTTWDERRKMTPGDEVRFDYAKWTLRMEMNNAHLRDQTQPSFEVAAIRAFADRKAGIPDPEAPAGVSSVKPSVAGAVPDTGLADATPFSRRRRKRTPAPA